MSVKQKGVVAGAVMKRRVSFKIKGRVQGVAFRASARDEAHRLSVNGWIRNLATGEVAGEAEGEASAVDAFLAFLGKGPPGARVDRLDVEDTTLYGDLKRFEIRR
jgi:acylphosphatase